MVESSGVEVGGWGSSKPGLIENSGTIWEVTTNGAAIQASTAAAAAAAAATGGEFVADILDLQYVTVNVSLFPIR